ncbi:tungstate ABC transporter substrate-binding protein WtpA [Candidatus Bathyarchaeota archaeon]|nr:tungstate ABC transporter substrate-binding protein WtpA [Candidatus Bathyarchaeota archaeon]
MNRTALAAVAAVALLGAAAYLIFFTSDTPESEPVKIKVFCAGSLLHPLNMVSEAFMEDNPGYEVEVEGHGSIQVIRHHTELDDPASLLLVADYSLIPVMMYDAPLPDGGGYYTDWYIRFAGNEIVLAYTEASLYSGEVDESNWYDVVSRQDVKLCFSNPIIDALGYRGLQIMQLAEQHYDEPSLFEESVGRHFDPEIETVDTADRTYIFVPEELKPSGGKVSVRASSIQIMPLLESGAVDYTFLYLSNAKQYGVEYIELPPEINMGSPENDELYRQAYVRFQYARFQSIGLDREGKTIYYGLNIPVNAPEPEAAAVFAEYLLAGRGRQIFAEQSHPIYEPCYTDNLGGVPDNLKNLVVEDTYGR